MEPRALNDVLLDPARRPAVVTDLQELVDLEVSDKSGVSGAVIKTGYATVKKLKPSIVGNGIDRLLGEFGAALELFYSDYRASTGGGDFGAYLSARPEAADALLGVADARAEQTSSDGVRKVYGKLRPHGQRNVAEALPRLGRLIDKHAAVAG